jgi:hypothetical protein
MAAFGMASCGGASGVATEASSATDGSESSSDGASITATSDDLPQPAEITISLSEVRAFLIQEENSPIEPDASDSDDSDQEGPETSAQEEETGTGTDVETNFWTLDSDGNLRPAVTAVGGENVKRIEIERIDVAPTGEVYFLFAHTVSLMGEYCKWIVVNPSAPDTAECADPDTRFAFAQIKFAYNGTVYYSDTDGQIRVRRRIDKQIKTLFTSSNIDFILQSFVPAPDGSIMIVGDLTGTSQRFFRLIFDEEGGVVMEAQCIENVKVKTKGSVPGNEMFISTAGELYVKSTHDVCSELPDARLYRGVFADGELAFSPIEGVDTDFFAEDSTGRVYAINQGGDGDASTIVRVDGGEDSNSIVVPLTTVETMRVIGDDVYVTGENESGQGAFLRKNLSSEEEWDDLLFGGDFVIQEFQADASGTVYFGAVDYDDVAARKLFRYDASEGVLDPIAALPENLKEIVFIGTDGTDPFGLDAL